MTGMGIMQRSRFGVRACAKSLLPREKVRMRGKPSHQTWLLHRERPSPWPSPFGRGDDFAQALPGNEESVQAHGWHGDGDEPGEPGGQFRVGGQLRGSVAGQSFAGLLPPDKAPRAVLKHARASGTGGRYPETLSTKARRPPRLQGQPEVQREGPRFWPEVVGRT